MVFIRIDRISPSHKLNKRIHLIADLLGKRDCAVFFDVVVEEG